MVEGKSGCGPITQFDASQCKTHFACEVKGFDPKQYLDRKEIRKMDRYTQLAMASAIQGVEDSGIDAEGIDKNRVGVIYGVGIGGINTFQKRSCRLRSEHRARPVLLAVLHPNDDLGYCRWTDFHQVWIPRPQLRNDECMRLFDERPCRRFQPPSLR